MVVPSITVEELAAKIAAGQPIVLLDVRERHELDISRLDPCTHIPMGQVLSRSSELPPEAEICVLCRSGRRSLTIARTLVQIGFRKVYNVAGGINAYAQRIDPTLTVY